MQPAFSPTLDPAFVVALSGRCPEPPPANRALGVRRFHVLYGGAHRFSANTPSKLAQLAAAAFRQGCVDRAAFGRAMGLRHATLADELCARVERTMSTSPIRALCIDFEDGYGPRSDAEEDTDAERAARELATTETPGVHIGIRIKALQSPTVRRALRTLDLFVTTLARSSRGAFRPEFTVTLPKVRRADEVHVLGEALSCLEERLQVPAPIGIELMVETRHAMVHEGSLALPSLLRAAGKRAVGVHFGAYDFASELGVSASDQRLGHPACNAARFLMRLAVDDPRVELFDGATTQMPVTPDGASPSERAQAIEHAWQIHTTNIHRAIDQGFFSGWDLHPAQLPARFGALYAYFLDRRAEMTERLRSFVTHAAKASRVGQAFDDAATGLGMLSFFALGIECGALTTDDLAKTTLSPSDLQKSFADIIESKRSQEVQHP